MTPEQRDELVGLVADIIDNPELTTAEYIVDGGIELPGGARLMIGEPMLVAPELIEANGGELFRQVTPEEA